MTALVPDALDANKAGRLTDAQRQYLRSSSRGMRKGELQFAAIFTVMSLLVWFAPGPAKYAQVKPLVGIAFLILAGALVVRAFMGADTGTQDLRDGRVESVEGAVTKSTVSSQSGSSGTTSYYVHVDKVRAETGSGFYNAVPAAGMVRMYYLPHSHHLVNLEQLADVPLPEGALTDPKVAINAAKQAILGSVIGDPIKAAGARAQLASIEHAMSAPITKDPVGPPAESRDPRPLGDAIVGSWKNVMMAISFSADGSVAATMPGGMQRSGRWSVDPSGHLQSDVMGGEAAAEAWVVGDSLTIDIGSNAMTFQRVG